MVEGSLAEGCAGAVGKCAGAVGKGEAALARGCRVLEAESDAEAGGV